MRRLGRDGPELQQNKSFLEVVPQPASVENKPMAQYIIWNPASNLPPKTIQPDRQTAIRIAGRMAHEKPGQTFYVCKLTNSATKPIPVDVKYEDLDR